MNASGRMRSFRAPAVAAMLLAAFVFAANADLRFAWLSDTHIGSPNFEEDLRASVKDINSIEGLSFVLVSGDVTEFGSHAQFLTAKALLDQLRIPCHVVPGNHDCKWSESGATEFAKMWGADRFVFDADGYCFVGLHQGPIMKMGDGHFRFRKTSALACEHARWVAKRPAYNFCHALSDGGRNRQLV